MSTGAFVYAARRAYNSQKKQIREKEDHCSDAEEIAVEAEPVQEFSHSQNGKISYVGFITSKK
jgi:hypothetical protein